VTGVPSSPRPGERLLDLVAVMDRLRSPGGCPWDAEQTHTSLVEYLVEEAYEAVEAIETSDDAALREELGDLLLQVVFHARIAEEHDEPWSIDDVASGIVDKLVSRHPHVFADVDAATAADVEANWAVLKAAEKGRASITDGVPQALPALVLAAKLMSRAKRVEVEPAAGDAAAAAASAVASVAATRPDAESAYGDLLLALVAQARADGVDAEQALRASVRDYRARVRAAEGVAD
jgi:XTP/dITP diphosphohydrolase